LDRVVPLCRLVEQRAELLHGALVRIRCDGVLLEEVRVDTAPQGAQRGPAVPRRHRRGPAPEHPNQQVQNWTIPWDTLGSGRRTAITFSMSGGLERPSGHLNGLRIKSFDSKSFSTEDDDTEADDGEEQYGGGG
jgi:hypothetical protein